MAKKRRGHGEGSITKLANGRFRASITIGYDAQGRQRFKTATRRTHREAQAALDQLKRDRDAGKFGPAALSVAKQPAAAWLHQWFDDTPLTRWSPNTRTAYRHALRRITAHLPPRITLPQLTAQHLDRALHGMEEAGYAPSTVVVARAVVMAALDDAKRWKLVTENVARDSERPTVIDPDFEVFDLDQAQRFLQAAREDQFDALWHVLLLGLREGEALGLRWSDLDLDAGTLTVRWQLQRMNVQAYTAAQLAKLEIVPLRGSLVLKRPKSKRGRRTIDLPKTVIAALRRHRAAQLEARLWAGTKWQDFDLVFTTHFGTPIYAWQINVAFKALCERAGLPQIRVHDLRHSAATILLVLGESDRVIMDVIGHADRRMFERYTHVVKQLKARIAATWDAALGDQEAG